jgi:microcystin-dependent protein
MSFQIQDIEEINTITQTLLLLSPFNTFTVGDYKMSAFNQDNGYWLLCDGRSLEIITYPQLYTIIGTSFGSVDQDHFNLPDFRGRVPGAIGQGNGLTNRSLGNSVGAETHTLTTPQIPSHTHTGTTDPSGTHIHSITDGGHIHDGGTESSGVHTHTSNAIGGQGNYGLALADGNNTVEDTDSSQGELNVWTTPGALTINENGAHTHNFTSNINTTGITINSNGSHTHDFTTNATGGGESHNNMQPTLFGGNIFILSKSLTNSYINYPANSI